MKKEVPVFVWDVQSAIAVIKWRVGADIYMGIVKEEMDTDVEVETNRKRGGAN